MQSNRYYYRLFLIITDFILLDMACKVAHFLRFEHYDYEYIYAVFFIIFSLSWVGSALFHNLYELERLFDFKQFIKQMWIVFGTQLLIICLYMVSFKTYYYSRFFIGTAYLLSVTGIISFRYIMSRMYRYYRSISYSVRRILIVGQDGTSNALYDFFQNQDARTFRFEGNFEKGEKYLPHKQQLEKLKHFCVAQRINELYFTLSDSSDEFIEELSRFADEHFIYFRIITNFNLLQRKDVKVELFGHVPIVTLRKEPLNALGNRLLKRGFDIVFSFLVIVLLFPFIFPIVALLIKLDSPGPVFFKQLRSGRKNREFWCYKFRTMRVNRKSDVQQAQKNDKRITKLGAFLRKSSIDELPQFFNVLKGDMSVVGPRPHMLKHTEEYSKIVERFLVRHFVTPGITGYAQINGYRGGTEDPRLMEKRVEYDTWYLKNWSLFLDLKIVFLTVWNMVRGEENAY